MKSCEHEQSASKACHRKSHFHGDLVLEVNRSQASLASRVMTPSFGPLASSSRARRDSGLPILSRIITASKATSALAAKWGFSGGLVLFNVARIRQRSA